MGFIAKSATKKRTQPLSAPLNPALVNEGPWTTNGGIPAGGLVRSAVIAVDITGARSTSMRGRTTAVAAVVAPSSVSHLWVQMTGPREWSFVLGVKNVRGGISADWAVDLRIVDREIRVSTTHYLTHDDVLVHGDQHDALRNGLVRALSLGEQVDAGAEDALSTGSLTRPLSLGREAPAPTTVAFRFDTAHNPAECWQRLRLLGYRELPHDEQCGRWGLGLPANDNVDHVSLAIGPGSAVGDGRIGSEGKLDRRSAEAGLRSFIERTRFLLGRDDPDLRYDGPSEWSGGRLS
jgi:hypothetical protein